MAPPLIGRRWADKESAPPRASPLAADWSLAGPSRWGQDSCPARAPKINMWGQNSLAKPAGIGAVSPQHLLRPSGRETITAAPIGFGIHMMLGGLRRVAVRPPG